MTVTTALYRRYRPDSFADVIGQEHVTEPLMTALRKNRVNHAYLFSGPRGCGKTTSARILARCLNCAQGPTDTPCGSCPSCVELARGGSGSLDVIEIDAASHGGVDDARDLRERATYAPVRDRYKIFIIDEAHMVTSAGFNALLKIVEEPPEHIKFIFATTEPDKVIGTIRSRTHHYPFRLVPPEPLMAYLELLCNQENVPVAPGVLSLVIRAGGGSVRDSLSVLDQLMAGAGPNGLDYELAVALLGYTHASLLDDVVEAVAASDAATVFRAVDRVIQTGHDPRRFVEDLLERFRDLIIVKAMPESAQTILRGMPADQIARLQNQAHNLGSAELSRAADVTNTALTEMTGATSPRLHLELLCARILLPSSEQNERGIAARIDRVERRLSYGGNDVGAPATQDAGATAGAPQPGPAHAPHPPAQQAPAQHPPAQQSSGSETVAPQAPAPAPAAAPAPAPKVIQAEQPAPQPRPEPAPATGRAPLTPPRVSTTDWPVDGPADSRAPNPGAQVPPVPEQPSAQPSRQEPAAQKPAQEAPAPARTPATQAAPAAAASAPPSVQPAQPASPTPSGPSGDVEMLRRAWPDVLQTLAGIKRSTWALVEPNAQVSAFDGQVLTLAFATPGLAGAFGRADHSENLRQAIHKTTGIDCQVNAAAGNPGAGNAGAGNMGKASSEPNPKAPASPAVPAGPGAAPTSADVAWGLAPAPAAVPAPAPAGASIPLSSAPTTAPPSSAGAPLRAPAEESGTAARPAPGAVPATAPQPVPAAQPAPAGAVAPPAAPAGDYSYSDDDWGPPRDEDAPPLEEEPPMDWEPAPQQRPRSTAPRPDPARPAAATAAVTATSTSTSGAETAPSPEDASGGNGPGADPWARAVEQAPGVWVVGEASNIGKQPPSDVPAPEEPARMPAPHYEPATAQVPPSIPVNPPDEPVREYAMASASGQATAAAATATVAATPTVTAPPTKAETRQSLYQRLSNSPEAEAGRAKAPARAVAAATTYVQDIPSADDETIEESGVFGRAAVERILGGKLIEERSSDGSPVTPRF